MSQLSTGTSDLELLRVVGSAKAAELCGYSEEHWRKKHRNGEVPPAIRLSAKKYGWRIADLIAWQDSLKRAAA